MVDVQRRLCNHWRSGHLVAGFILLRGRRDDDECKKRSWTGRRRAGRAIGAGGSALVVLVATGLWPLPEKTPLNPVIHGKVERPGFTVEKVYFESVEKTIMEMLTLPGVQQWWESNSYMFSDQLQDYVKIKMPIALEKGYNSSYKKEA